MTTETNESLGVELLSQAFIAGGEWFENKTMWAGHDALCSSAIDHGEANQGPIADLVKENSELKALSVTNILLGAVPGSDGMGEEVYAESVSDVQDLLSNLYEQIENLGEALAKAHK